MCEEQDACDRTASSLLFFSTAVGGVKPSWAGRKASAALLSRTSTKQSGPRTIIVCTLYSLVAIKKKPVKLS